MMPRDQFFEPDPILRVPTPKYIQNPLKIYKNYENLKKHGRFVCQLFVNKLQSGYGQEDAPGGHKTLGSEKSIDLAEDTRVRFGYVWGTFGYVLGMFDAKNVIFDAKNVIVDAKA